jgi:hypothetical protein
VLEERLLVVSKKAIELSLKTEEMEQRIVEGMTRMVLIGKLERFPSH